MSKVIEYFDHHAHSSSCTLWKQRSPLLVEWVGCPTIITVQNAFVSFLMWPKVIFTECDSLKIYQEFFEFAEGELEALKASSV